MSDKDQKKKDGESKSHHNQRQHDAESNPEVKAKVSAAGDRTETGHSAGADAPGANIKGNGGGAG